MNGVVDDAFEYMDTKHEEMTRARDERHKGYRDIRIRDSCNVSMKLSSSPELSES